MPHQRSASIAEYTPFHISAAGSGAIGLTNRVQTTSTTTITAGLNQPFTPASLANFFVGMALVIYGGTGSPEMVQVIRVDKVNNLVYANFGNNHSGTWNIKSIYGTYMGPMVANKLGSAETLSFFHGDPNVTGLAGYPGTAIATVTPSASNPYSYGLWLPYGLYYSYAATTAGSYTVHYMDAQ